MKAEEIPAELLSILDTHAAKLHSRTGSVATALAEILTAYDAMRPNRAQMLQEWSAATGGDHLSLEAWADLRKSLLNEECKELCDAIDYFVATGDPRPMAKESADVEYVVVGAAQRPGIDLEVAFLAVHESNMTKIGPDGVCITRSDGKILKPPGYKEADMTAAVSGGKDFLGKTETVLDWVEHALRSIPPVTRAVLIVFFACALSALAINAGYLFAGGR